MAIKEIGKIYKFDKDDYLITNHNISNVGSKWLKAIDESVNFLKEQNVHSIYLKGSVMEGQAIDNVSDLDFIILYKEDVRLIWDAPSDWEKSLDPLRKNIKDKYPFINGFDSGNPNYYKEITDKNKFMIKHQSICIYGDNIQDSISKFKRGSFPIVSDTLSLVLSQGTAKFLASDIDKQRIIMSMTGKTILRSGFEYIHKDKYKDIWTRSLYYCYKFLCEVYPDKKDQIKKCLKVVITPSNSIDDLVEIVEFGNWLLDSH